MQAEAQKVVISHSAPTTLPLIAFIVKELRTHLGWKQLALAHEAGVNTRIIERIEAGERMADDTLKKAAKALKLAEGVCTEPHFVLSAEELAAMAKRAKEDYTLAPLNDISARDL